MDAWEIGQLAAFVLVTSAIVIALDLGMRRAAKGRRRSTKG